MTYDELATGMGYKMMQIIGTMYQLGLTTLPHFTNTYLDPSATDSPVLRDFERWLKWATAPKNFEGREHLFPTEFAQICQGVLVGAVDNWSNETKEQ
jgi:hypothetical protein